MPEKHETVFYQHVNINKADVEELKAVPGFDDEIARSVVEYRGRLGKFRNWEDLTAIPGFTKGFIEDLKKLGCSLNGG